LTGISFVEQKEAALVHSFSRKQNDKNANHNIQQTKTNTKPNNTLPNTIIPLFSKIENMVK